MSKLNVNWYYFSSNYVTVIPRFYRRCVFYFFLHTTMITHCKIFFTRVSIVNLDGNIHVTNIKPIYIFDCDGRVRTVNSLAKLPKMQIVTPKWWDHVNVSQLGHFSANVLVQCNLSRQRNRSQVYFMALGWVGWIVVGRQLIIFFIDWNYFPNIYIMLIINFINTW